MACRKNSWFAGVMSALPRNSDTSRTTMPWLNAWPVRRMVPSVPEATPRNFAGRALITELVLGELKKPKPAPITTWAAITR